MEDYSKLKVAELKGLLRAKDLAVGGTKPVLLARLKAAPGHGTANGIAPVVVASSTTDAVPPPRPTATVKATPGASVAPGLVDQARVPPSVPAARPIDPIAKVVVPAITRRPAFRTPFKSTVDSQGDQTQTTSCSTHRAAPASLATSTTPPRYPHWFQRLQSHLNAHRPDPIVLDNIIAPAIHAESSDRQFKIALRFLIARIYTLLMTHSSPLDALNRMESIEECATVVDGLARIRLADREMALFFIEATGEVIGMDEQGLGARDGRTRLRIRSDWQEWIDEWTERDSLLERVRTSDEEMYPCGISSSGRRRMGEEELEVAVTFVLSHATPNSISGTYHSTSSEAAMVAGLSTSTLGSTKPKLGFYLAPPNHVESVHLPSTLSPDLAIVHTANGSVVVLRQTGQHVGSEEEGVMEAWKELLGCDELGARA